MMNIKDVLLQCSIIFLKKKTSGSGLKNKIISNKELAENLHKPFIKKFKKIKVQSSFIYSIWGTDHADMQLISKFNKGTHFLLCLFNISSKYAWVIPLKDKNFITTTNFFQKFLKESNWKSNKILVDKGNEF